MENIIIIISSKRLYSSLTLSLHRIFILFLCIFKNANIKVAGSRTTPNVEKNTVAFGSFQVVGPVTIIIIIIYYDHRFCPYIIGLAFLFLSIIPFFYW